MRLTVLATAVAIPLLAGCASITNDPNQQISFKAPGCKKGAVSCTARNKRGSWSFEVPATVPIRRSDDALHIECEDDQGGRHTESVNSRMGGKIVASAVFLDFGIVDSITDKHREYPEQSHPSDLRWLSQVASCVDPIAM